MSDTISNSAQGTTDSARLSNQKEQEPGIDLWSVRMADSCMKRQPILADVWSYESGVVLKGIEQVWLDTGNKKYFEYIKRNVEQFVKPDGDIRTYNLQDYNLDQINSGKLFFRLYQETGDERYQQALHLLMKQLKTQPRTSEGGFWHKKIYPYQMWLDGIYMAAPFYVQYADSFNEPGGFDDAAHQILLIERHTRDPKTGLYYHAWDESKMQKWANPQTGCSPHFWGRAMGWYAMAIVDVLDFLPASHQSQGQDRDDFRKNDPCVGAGSGYRHRPVVSGIGSRRLRGELYRSFGLLHVCLCPGKRDQKRLPRSQVLGSGPKRIRRHH